jgi:hypothetical protein
MRNGHGRVARNHGKAIQPETVDGEVAQVALQSIDAARTDGRGSQTSRLQAGSAAEGKARTTLLPKRGKGRGACGVPAFDFQAE